ncbi:hypothetical protein [Sanguibacter sp. HDW7]|uniref:hypothetical protein n=1 Tax=Sanguibacter sp. HDW7 TaxID=2714931 RepID=UPI0014072BE2|nr:hypothetical protein [Sanguibacter sp. HDW7]QIK82946.1 hypothetical protein G7063_04385 [Sanguibacter sp. HDW7]
MDISLTVPELLQLAAPDGLPPGIGTPVLVGDTLTVDVDPRELPGLPTAARLAARAAGRVVVTVRVLRLASGVAVLDVAASARSLPAHRLVGLFLGTVENTLRGTLAARGVSGDAVRVRPDGARLEVLADTTALLAPAPLPPHLRGLRVTELHVGGGRLHVGVALP